MRWVGLGWGEVGLVLKYEDFIALGWGEVAWHGVGSCGLWWGGSEFNV